MAHYAPGATSKPIRFKFTPKTVKCNGWVENSKSPISCRNCIVTTLTSGLVYSHGNPIQCMDHICAGGSKCFVDYSRNFGGMPP